MARKAKKGVLLPESVSFTQDHLNLLFKSSLGENSVVISNNVKVVTEDSKLFVQSTNNSKQAKADVGLFHALINNAVTGLVSDFEEILTLSGVGYRLIQKGSQVELQLGYSHPIVTNVDDSIKLTVNSPTELSVKGVDLQKVTSVASKIVSYRAAKKDPYKQKGVRRSTDILRKKQGKKVK